MAKRIKTIKGLFGQLIHYEDGVKIGESWNGFFEGSYTHYDSNGNYTGRSDPGIVADLIHHDEHGSHAGSTYTGLFGDKKHYDQDGYVGSSYDSLSGFCTDVIDFDE